MWGKTIHPVCHFIHGEALPRHRKVVQTIRVEVKNMKRCHGQNWNTNFVMVFSILVDHMWQKLLSLLIIKITISSLVIGLKKSYFPLIRLPGCYRTVCYWIVCYWTVCYRTVQKANHIQRCSVKQQITFKVVITCAWACACFCVYTGNLTMFTPPLSVF